MKICNHCGKAIPFDSRATKYCSDECRKRVKYEKDRAWALANPEKVAECSRKWREENPEIVLQRGRDSYKRKLKKQFESEGIK